MYFTGDRENYQILKSFGSVRTSCVLSEFSLEFWETKKEMNSLHRTNILVTNSKTTNNPEKFPLIISFYFQFLF